jgi:hypothetical protein
MSNLSQSQVGLLLELVLNGLLANLDSKSNVIHRGLNDELTELQGALWDMLED